MFSENEMGFGGGSWLLWVLVILCLFNGNGMWGGNNAGAYENYVLNSDFATLQRQIDTLESDLKQSNVSIGNGLSSLGYDQLAQMNNINNTVMSTGYNLQNAIQSNAINDMQNTNAIGAQITALGNQMQSCCCDNRYDMATQFANIGYNLADQSCQIKRSIADATTAITANQDANTRSILDFLTQDKIATLTAENQNLKFAASQQAQNAYLINALSSNCGGIYRPIA